MNDSWDGKVDGRETYLDIPPDFPQDSLITLSCGRCTARRYREQLLQGFFLRGCQRHVNLIPSSVVESCAARMQHERIELEVGWRMRWPTDDAVLEPGRQSWSPAAVMRGRPSALRVYSRFRYSLQPVRSLRELSLTRLLRRQIQAWVTDVSKRLVSSRQDGVLIGQMVTGIQTKYRH